MSYITQTGNLAAAPELRQGEKGPYTYARVLVSDRIRGEDGSYVDGPTIAYNVAVSGSQAENLVAAAEASGNIRVVFGGDYRVSAYSGEKGTRENHDVRADFIAVSLRGQSVTVSRRVNDDKPF